jgi:adenylate kinase family enzyme
LKRVLIIGSGGAGKTTFAKQLAERTGLPLVHLDRLYWRAGWNPTPPEAWRAAVAQLIERDSWIMDGNYGGTLDIRLQACDTIVFLDLSRFICLWRVLKRHSLHRGRNRPELPAGCPEQLSWEFVKWIWTYPRLRRPGIMRRLAELGDQKRVITLRSQSEVEQFLGSLSRVAP